MSRLEENDLLIQAATEIILQKNGYHDSTEKIAWDLGMIQQFIVDISKSLAIIADKMEGKENEQLRLKQHP